MTEQTEREDTVVQCPTEGQVQPDQSFPVQGRPLIVGEALIDEFSDGRKILGGAPFNVAWNLKGLGFDPLLVSGLGTDEEGSLFDQAMTSWGMNRQGLQMIDSKPTGKVRVSFRYGEPRYEFGSDQAYDNLAAVDLRAMDGTFGLVYHGSLVYRSPVSRATLRQLIDTSGIPRFVDVNIRQPHFELSWIPELLVGATWVKLNLDELAFLTGVAETERLDVRLSVERLRKDFGPATYFITAGSAGAYAIDDDGLRFAKAPKPKSMIDTVGAGDAFSAATIAGILRRESIKETLSVAVRFASRICGVKGATCEDLNVYAEI